MLAAILLLAFWSMFTGSVTLKWSAGNLTRLSDKLFDTPLYEDLDILVPLPVSVIELIEIGRSELNFIVTDNANLRNFRPLNLIRRFDFLVFFGQEVEEREKVVRHMWEVYIHGSNRLPRFWSEAFQAAYDSLASDVPAVRDAAISEIAKLSLNPTFSSDSSADDSSDPLFPAHSLVSSSTPQLETLPFLSPLFRYLQNRNLVIDKGYGYP